MEFPSKISKSRRRLVGRKPGSVVGGGNEDYWNHWIECQSGSGMPSRSRYGRFFTLKWILPFPTQITKSHQKQGFNPDMSRRRHARFDGRRFVQVSIPSVHLSQLELPNLVSKNVIL